MFGLAEVEKNARKQPRLGRTRASTVAARAPAADEQCGVGVLSASCVALRWVRCRAEAWQSSRTRRRGSGRAVREAPWWSGHGLCRWHAQSTPLADREHVYPVLSCTGGCCCGSIVSSRCGQRPVDDLGTWGQLVWPGVQVSFKTEFLHQTLAASSDQMAWSLKLKFCVQSTLRKD